MAKGFARVAQALAEVAAGVGGGYGKGLGMDYMNRREEFMQSLRDQRAAQMAAEDRAYRSEEAEKGRGFEKEMFGEKMGWEKEKFGMEQEADKEKFERDAALRLKIAGMSAAKGPEEPADIRQTKILAEKMFGKGYTNEQFMQVYDKYQTTKSGGASIPDAIEIGIKRAELRKAAEAGDPVAAAQLKEIETLTNPRSRDGDDPAKEIYKEINNELKGMQGVEGMMDPELRGKSQEEKAAIAANRVNARRKALGMPVQESVAEVEQPQADQAPATDTSGAKPTSAVPRGEGNERSPYVVETPEQQKWILEKAKPGSVVLYNGKIFTK